MGEPRYKVLNGGAEHGRYNWGVVVVDTNEQGSFAGFGFIAECHDVATPGLKIKAGW